MSVLRRATILPPFVVAAITVSAAAPVLAQGTFTELYKFTGGADGAEPEAVALDSAGNIYGEASAGGIVPCDGYPYGCGTVFKIDPSGHETTLVTFDGENGAEPGAEPNAQPLVVGNVLYGSAESGGSDPQCGLIFSVATDGTEFTPLHEFNYTDGCGPLGPLVLAPGGKAIYGIAAQGGRGNRHQGNGIIYQLNIGGGFAILHAFDGTDGYYPNSLLMDANGMLYGSTTYGGAKNYGVVFSLDPKTGAYNVLYSFTGKKDENGPQLGSIGPGGVLYGAASGVPYKFGTLFSLTPSAGSYAYAELFTFQNNSQDAVYPVGGPQILPGGNLVGELAYGLYIYDQSVPHGGVYFTPRTAIDPNFTSATGGLTLVGGLAYGSGGSGGTPTQMFPSGAGVIYRWSPGSQ
jgi:uncharacterized repeat protein (TIGR03803 family)